MSTDNASEVEMQFVESLGLSSDLTDCIADMISVGETLGIDGLDTDGANEGIVSELRDLDSIMIALKQDGIESKCFLTTSTACASPVMESAMVRPIHLVLYPFVNDEVQMESIDDEIGPMPALSVTISVQDETPGAQGGVIVRPIILGWPLSAESISLAQNQPLKAVCVATQEAIQRSLAYNRELPRLISTVQFAILRASEKMESDAKRIAEYVFKLAASLIYESFNSYGVTPTFEITDEDDTGRAQAGSCVTLTLGFENPRDATLSGTIRLTSGLGKSGKPMLLATTQSNAHDEIDSSNMDLSPTSLGKLIGLVTGIEPISPY